MSDLVVAFIEGIEHDADPPLPGEAGPRVETLWVPGGGSRERRRTGAAALVVAVLLVGRGSALPPPRRRPCSPSAVNDCYTASTASC